MEEELNIPTCLFGGPPVIDDVIKLGESQQGFMTIFARPLFESVTEILPSMHFTIDELEKNRTTWEEKMEEQRKLDSKSAGSQRNPQSPLIQAPEGSSAASPKKSSTADNIALQDSEGLVAGETITALLSHEAESRGRSLTTGAARSPPPSGPLPPTPSDSAMSPNGASPTSPSSPTSQVTGNGHHHVAQRAVSAHHPRTAPRPDDSHDPMPNGTNPGFAASETDVRYLGNGDGKFGVREHSNGVGAEHSSVGSEDGTGKKTKKSWKRFWKRKKEDSGSLSSDAQLKTA
jgi:hypothetical protein